MKLLINPQPDLKKVKMTCDGELSSKLKQYPLTCDHLNKYNTTVFIGTQGSGKTSLMVNFVKKLFDDVFNNIYVFMPKSSRASLENNIFERRIRSENVYDELNESNIEELNSLVQANSARGLKSLIIMDDVQKSLKSKWVLKGLKNIIANQRHLKCVTLIMVQNYFALDRSLRELINNGIIFKLGKLQMKKVYEELIETDTDNFEDVIDLVFDKPYEYLFINIGSQRIYKGFDEIVDLDDED